jgi:hypothetical protein
MATGGFSVVTATTTDTVIVAGRVSSAGVKVAPASGAGLWKVVRNSAGNYTVTFSQQYAEFLGASVDVESTGSTSTVGFTWSSATRTLTIAAWVASVATDTSVSFQAFFSENRAP